MPAKKRTGRVLKYDRKYCVMVKEFGKQGFAIGEVAEKIGVHESTVRGWEKRIPEFRKAFSRVRENSERWKALRFERLLRRNEQQLLAALARIREKRAAELAKYQAKFRVTKCE